MHRQFLFISYMLILHHQHELDLNIIHKCFLLISLNYNTPLINFHMHNNPIRFNRCRQIIFILQVDMFCLCTHSNLLEPHEQRIGTNGVFSLTYASAQLPANLVPALLPLRDGVPSLPLQGYGSSLVFGLQRAVTFRSLYACKRAH
jgi:hypothetical protein